MGLFMWNRITILVAKLVLLIATFTKCMSLENSLKSSLLRLIIRENTLLVKKILRQIDISLEDICERLYVYG